MKINEIAKVLFDWNPTDHPCKSDVMVFGDGDADVKKAAVCCIATCDVIRQAKDLGADLIITHEPTFHSYASGEENDIVAKGKRKLIEEANIPIFRVHDHTHFAKTDRIIEGVLKKLDWKGEFDGDHKFIFEKEKTVEEIQKDFERRLGLKHIRICGAKNGAVKTISMCVGSWGDETVHSELVKEETDAVVCGEITEWRTCEYVRDSAELGIRKTLFLLGHMGSEKSGMEYVCEYLSENIKDVDFIYIDCKEVY